MFNGDMDFTFDDLANSELETKYITQSVNALAVRSQSKQRVTFNIKNQLKQLSILLENPPTKNDSYRFLSVHGGFSSITFIKYIAEREPIQEMFASSLCVGSKHIKILDDLFNQNKLSKVSFVVCTIFKQTKMKEYNYFDVFNEICKKNNWKVAQVNNHSKLILMRTANNFYVLETSSNLNENPKIEQFCFENDKQLYEFYYDFFTEVLNVNKKQDDLDT